MGINHAKVSTAPDEGDPAIIDGPDWNQDHTITTGINLPDQANIPPSAPAGQLTIFNRQRAGRALLHSIGPAGIDIAYQPSFFGNTIHLWTVNTGTTVAIAFGTPWAARNSGTSAAQDTPARISTNALTSLARARFGTGTTATGASGIESTNTVGWRGNAAKLGGFFFAARFAVETHEAAMRYFIGMRGASGALAAEPSVSSANMIGLCKDSTDTTWQIVSRNATTTTKTPTGLAITAGQILDLFLFCAPNDTKITARLVDPITDVVIVDDVDITATLPVNTAMLFASALCQSTVGTTAKLLALNRMYIENDL